jgi:hypothetical protein
MRQVYECSYHEDRVAILCFGPERRQTLRQPLFQVMFSSKSKARMLRKSSCGAGVKDTRQLPYTSFLRFDTGRPEETADTEKANHSKVNHSPRDIIHKTGWTYRRSRTKSKLLTVGCTALVQDQELHCAKPLIIPIGGLRELGLHVFVINSCTRDGHIWLSVRCAPVIVNRCECCATSRRHLRRQERKPRDNLLRFCSSLPEGIEYQL